MSTKLKPCPYCQGGEENKLGDVWYRLFDINSTTSIYHMSPRILKRNNRYFLVLENFPLLQIKACPVCGRRFEDAQ